MLGSIARDMCGIAVRARRLRIDGVVAALSLFVLIAAGSAEARYAAIVIHSDSGEVLYEKNADTLNYPASLTKMMTLYLAFEALEAGRLHLDQPLTVSRRAAAMPPSKLGLKPGTTIAVEAAILALVIKSANDAAVVLAEAIGGSEATFADMMSKRAHALGMERTTFRNASGLPNRGQLSTARDMATLSRALLHDRAAYYRYFATDRFTHRGRTLRNHNRLLRRYQGADGIKTGYTRASGYNLAASAVRDQARIIAVVFGGRTAKWRDRHTAALLDRGFARLAIRESLQSIGPPVRKPLETAVTSMTVAGNKADTAARRPAAPSGSDAQGLVQLAFAPLPDGVTYGVQVGAYYDPDLALRNAIYALNQIPDLLSAARISIRTSTGRRGPIYQARFVGLSKTHAERACRELETINIDCLVMRLHDAAELAFGAVSNRSRS